MGGQASECVVHMWRSQDDSEESVLSISTLCVLGIKLRSSALAASTEPSRWSLHYRVFISLQFGSQCTVTQMKI